MPTRKTISSVQAAQRDARRAARAKAGLTLNDVATRLGLSTERVRQFEREGAPLHRATQLAPLYRCSPNLFGGGAIGSTGAVGTPSIPIGPEHSQRAATSANLLRPTTRYRRPAAPILHLVGTVPAK